MGLGELCRRYPCMSGSTPKLSSRNTEAAVEVGLLPHGSSEQVGWPRGHSETCQHWACSFYICKDSLKYLLDTVAVLWAWACFLPGTLWLGGQTGITVDLLLQGVEVDQAREAVSEGWLVERKPSAEFREAWVRQSSWGINWLCVCLHTLIAHPWVAMKSSFTAGTIRDNCTSSNWRDTVASEMQGNVHLCQFGL